MNVSDYLADKKEGAQPQASQPLVAEIVLYPDGSAPVSSDKRVGKNGVNASVSRGPPPVRVRHGRGRGRLGLRNNNSSNASRTPIP